MRLLTPGQAQAVRSWFEPEQPGTLVGAHVLNTGNGAIFVDRWPEPRAVLAEVAGNFQLRGDGLAFGPDELRARGVGFVDAPERFEPVLRAAFPSLAIWERVVLDLPASPDPVTAVGATIRRLVAEDGYHVFGLSPEIAWICYTWGGRASFASGGYAWGAFVDGRLASMACSFFVGSKYEDIGVATEAGYRGRGLSTACGSALCRDIFRRGKRPSWSTSTDNLASLRVATKIGFVEHRRGRLFAVGIPIPT